MNVHQSLTAVQPVETPPIASAPIERDTMVRFESVSKIYPAYRDKPSVQALAGIDFAIPRGSITGVIGRSGAGKSSLVRLINGLEKPSAGRVVVDGRDISGLAGRELRLRLRGLRMVLLQILLGVDGQRPRGDGGGGGHDMRCETHRLAAWVELSHRSHRVATPEAPNFLPKIAPIDPEREVIGYNLPVSVWEDRPLQTVKNRTWAEKVSQTHAIDTQARPLVAQLGCDGRRVRACRRRLRLVFASRVAMVVRRSVLNRHGVPV